MEDEIQGALEHLTWLRPSPQDVVDSQLNPTMRNHTVTQRLKDVYSPDFVANLAHRVHRHAAHFNVHAFTANVFDEAWPQRELKQRMRHLAICLRAHISGSYREALGVLLNVAPHFSGFEAMFLPDFVEIYGQDDWEASLPALGVLTEWSSSEFAIRPFLIADPERGMAQMARWASDENHHRRRLASEGCRPRLPWAVALTMFQQDPTPIWSILNQLKADPERYVTRSVANNINDISKDHPEHVLMKMKSWQGLGKETDWVIKHACRTLLKVGHSDTLALFGFRVPTGMAVQDLCIQPQRPLIGDKVSLSFRLVPGKNPPDKLRLEYAIDFCKANGRQSRKVFHISERGFDGTPRTVVRQHDFRQRTTRKHYPGEHGLVVLVNGCEMVRLAFELAPARA